MLFHLRLEDIKDSLSGNRWERFVFTHYDHGRRNLKSHAWVARLAVVRGRIERHFVEQYRDFRDAIGNGGRGVYKDFFLGDGVYEVNSPVGWYNIDRYYCKIEGGVLEKVDKKQAIKCLR